MDGFFLCFVNQWNKGRKAVVQNEKNMYDGMPKYKTYIQTYKAKGANKT